MSQDAKAALRALEDCRVIRAAITHMGYRELLVAGLVTVSFVANRHDLRDYRLAA